MYRICNERYHAAAFARGVPMVDASS